MFEFGEELFDRVQIGRVFRQEEEVRCLSRLYFEETLGVVAGDESAVERATYGDTQLKFGPTVGERYRQPELNVHRNAAQSGLI